MAGTVNGVKPSSKELQTVFDGHISEDTLVLCDGLKGYIALKESTGCTVKDVNTDKIPPKPG